MPASTYTLGLVDEVPEVTQDRCFVDELLKSVEFTDADAKRLVALHPILEPHFDAIARELCAAALATSGVAVSQAHDAQLRSAMIHWMSSGLLGPHDGEAAIRHARAGRSELGNGFKPHWIITGTNLVRAAYVERIVGALPCTQAIDAIRSVNKLLDIDLAVMLRCAQVDSERKLALREHRVATEQLAAMTTLSSGLAHELRNPLNAAQLQLDVLRRRLRRTSTLVGLAEPTELAYHELTRLTAMVNDFLAFAKPSPLRAVDQDLITIVRQVVELERPLAERRGIELALEASRSSIQIRIDADKLQQAIQNLVRNAIEAVAAGGRVAVRVADDLEWIHVLVVDDGPGIPPQVLARMYEPFFSTKEAGTGLGMSIAKSLIGMQGGTIEVAASASGTTFDVALPREM